MAEDGHPDHLRDVFQGLHKHGVIYKIYDAEIRPVLDALAALPPIDEKSFQFETTGGEPGDFKITVSAWVGAAGSISEDQNDHTKEILIEIIRNDDGTYAPTVHKIKHVWEWESKKVKFCASMSELRAIIGSWIADNAPALAEAAKKAFDPELPLTSERLRTDRPLQAEKSIRFKNRN